MSQRLEIPTADGLGVAGTVEVDGDRPTLRAAGARMGQDWAVRVDGTTTTAVDGEVVLELDIEPSAAGRTRHEERT